MNDPTGETGYPELWADVYNRLAGAGQTARVMAACEALLFPGLPVGAHFLELGCGTGHVARELLARGFVVTGLDLSEAMLAHAAVNAPGGRFVAADMRRFDLPPVHDACLAIASIGHLATAGDLAATFANVHRALRPGGRLLCEVILPGVLDDDRVYPFVADDLAMVERESYPEGGSYTDTTTTIFYRRGDGWQRWNGRWRETNHAEAVLRAALAGAGFAATRVCDGTRDLALPELAERTYVIATRPAGPPG